MELSMRRSALVVVLALMLLPMAVMAQSPITLTLVTNGSELDEWQAVADAFHAAHPDIRIEIQLYPFAEYVDKIMVMFASGHPPDIFQTWAQYKPQWVRLGIVEDVTERWNSSPVIADALIYPFMLDAASYDGRVFGVPYDYNSTVYFVNRELLAQAGFDPPHENWDVNDLRTIGRALTNENWRTYGVGHGLTIGWGFNIQWFKNWTGQGWINDAGDRVLVNAPEALEMLEWWYESQYHYGIAPFPGSFPARGGFEAGGYALNQRWMNAAFDFPETLDWEMALYPKAPAGQRNFAQGHMFSMAYNTPHKEASWKFLEWMASYDGQVALVRYRKRQPIGPYQELWHAFFDQLPAGKGEEISRWVMGTLYGKGYAENLNYWTTFPEMNDMMIAAMREIYNNRQPVTSVMDDVARRMQQLLDHER